MPLFTVRLVYPPEESLRFIELVKKLPSTVRVLLPYTTIVYVQIVLAKIDTAVILLTNNPFVELYVKLASPIILLPVASIVTIELGIETEKEGPAGPVGPIKQFGFTVDPTTETIDFTRRISVN
jgi:hypothetical protein